MQFSRKTDYALILLEVLKSTFVTGEFFSVRVIAERERLPLAFLEKIAGVLKTRKVVESRKGLEGGYRLRRNPKSISLKEVIDIFEELPMMRCMRAPNPEKHCPLVPYCPTRSKWVEIEKQVNSIFERVTVAEL